MRVLLEQGVVPLSNDFFHSLKNRVKPKEKRLYSLSQGCVAPSFFAPLGRCIDAMDQAD